MSPESAPVPSGDPVPEVLDQPTLQNLVELDDGAYGLVEEMLQIFKDDTPQRIQDIVEAAAKGSAEDLSRAAHALKGGAGALGAKALRLYAADLEALGRSGSADAGPDLRADLERLFQASVQALEAFIAKG